MKRLVGTLRRELLDHLLILNQLQFTLRIRISEYYRLGIDLKAAAQP